jgi:hypothetical protein
MKQLCPYCGVNAVDEGKAYRCPKCSHRWRKSVFDPFGGKKELVELERRRRPPWAEPSRKKGGPPTAASRMYPGLASDEDMKG